eukprot:gene433-444_t
MLLVDINMDINMLLVDIEFFVTKKYPNNVQLSTLTSYMHCSEKFSVVFMNFNSSMSKKRLRNTYLTMIR